MKHLFALSALVVFGLGSIAAAPAIAGELAPVASAPISAPAAPAAPAHVGWVALFSSLFLVVGTFVANTHLAEGAIRLNEQQVHLLDTTGVSTAYILKTGSLKGAVKKLDSDDEHGAYRGGAFALGATDGSMTLQFINPGDLLPTRLQFFSAVDAAGQTQKILLLDVGNKFGAFEEATSDCDLRLCVNQAAITATLPSQTATA